MVGGGGHEYVTKGKESLGMKRDAEKTELEKLRFCQ